MARWLAGWLANKEHRPWVAPCNGHLGEPVYARLMHALPARGAEGAGGPPTLSAASELRACEPASSDAPPAARGFCLRAVGALAATPGRLVALDHLCGGDVDRHGAARGPRGRFPACRARRSGWRRRIRGAARLAVRVRAAPRRRCRPGGLRAALPPTPSKVPKGVFSSASAAQQVVHRSRAAWGLGTSDGAAPRAPPAAPAGAAGVRARAPRAAGARGEEGRRGAEPRWRRARAPRVGVRRRTGVARRWAAGRMRACMPGEQ